MSKDKNKPKNYSTGPEEQDNKQQVDRMLKNTALPEELRREIEKLRNQKRDK